MCIVGPINLFAVLKNIKVGITQSYSIFSFVKICLFLDNVTEKILNKISYKKLHLVFKRVLIININTFIKKKKSSLNNILL